MAKYVHVSVAKIAQTMAAESYQDMAMDDIFYKMWPKEREYVNKNWQQFVQDARKSLTLMLTMDKYTEDQKEEIMQALLLDRALPSKGDTSVQMQTQTMVH